MDIVIFGISGDLAQKKLVPALINLWNNSQLPKDAKLIGFSRSIKHYELPFLYEHIQGSYNHHDDYKILESKLRKDVKKIFYLALPPHATFHVLDNLRNINISNAKILIEKPFSEGYKSANELIEFINSNFSQNQVLKVDHYSGKRELRELEVRTGPFKKVTFEMIETGTVSHRNGYYDTAGALRDVGQNHLLYMLSTFFSKSGDRESVIKDVKIDGDYSKYFFGHYLGYDKIETAFSVPIIYNGSLCILRSGKALSLNKAGIFVEYQSGETEYIKFSTEFNAYENVFLDVIKDRFEGFIKDNEVLFNWKLIEEVEVVKNKIGIKEYPVGSHADDVLN